MRGKIKYSGNFLSIYFAFQLINKIGTASFNLKCFVVLASTSLFYSLSKEDRVLEILKKATSDISF